MGPGMSLRRDGALISIVPGSSKPVPPPDPPASPFQPFTLNADTGNLGDTGYYRTIYGTIDNEPLPDFPLLELATRHGGYTQVAFIGNCLEIAKGWDPIIPGITLTSLISDWAFDGTNTSCTWNSSGTMEVGEHYPISWTPTRF